MAADSQEADHAWITPRSSPPDQAIGAALVLATIRFVVVLVKTHLDLAEVTGRLDRRLSAHLRPLHLTKL